MVGKFKLVQYGCGPIGCSIAMLASRNVNIDVEGALDLAHAGRDLGKLAGYGERTWGYRF